MAEDQHCSWHLQRKIELKTFFRDKYDLMNVLVEMLRAELIQIQYWIPKCVKLSLLEARFQSNLPMSLIYQMFAYCDAEGNVYLLLEVLVDYHKDNKTISLSDQQTSIWDRPVTEKTLAGSLSVGS